MAIENEFDPQKDKESKEKLKDDTKEWVNNLSQEKSNQIKGLTDKERGAEINKYLKENNGELDSKQEEKIEQIDQILESAPKTETPIVVYQGIEDGNKVEPQDILENPGYLRALTEEDLDTDFVELIIPQGEPLVYVETEEQKVEIIGRRDSESEVTEVSQIKNRKGDAVQKIRARLLSRDSGLPRDFADNDAAKKWAEKNFKKWLDALTSEQKKFVNDPSRIKHLNEQLSLFPENKYLMDANARDDLQLLEKALQNKYAKLSKPLYVYKPLQPNDVGLADTPLYKKGTYKIDPAKYKDLQSGLRYGMIKEFMTAFLYGSSGMFSSPILLKLQLPKGTSIGLVSDNGIIISREHGFEILESSIVTNEKGEEQIKLEARLVPKETILQRVQVAETTLNEKFKSLLQIDQKLIKLDLECSLYTSSMLSRAETLIRQLTQNIPNRIIEKTVDKMGKQGAFVLTDSPLRKYLDKKGEDGLGGYVATLRQVFIQINAIDHLEQKGNDTVTIIHEFAHAFDTLLLNNASIHDKQFIDIYEKEKKNITIEPYITSNSEEFFAGVFSFMFSPDPRQREQIQKEAPEAYKFIQKLVDNHK